MLLIEPISKRTSRIQSELLEWGRLNFRPFQWRQSKAPYEILVAEILLKRTTAKAVARIYADFLRKYPSVKVLAQADVAELELMLKPIGYNKLRAKQLKVISESIVKDHAGRIPSDFDNLTQIPFIGSYTAGAIRCFGFGLSTPMVDSNVERIVSRLFAHSLGLKYEEITEVARKIIPKRYFREFNLALLDLGALVCTPRNQKCMQCPLRHVCDSGGLVVEGS